MPSDDDFASSNMLAEMLLISGVQVFANYVVAGNECAKIDIGSNNVVKGE